MQAGRNSPEFRQQSWNRKKRRQSCSRAVFVCNRPDSGVFIELLSFARNFGVDYHSCASSEARENNAELNRYFHRILERENREQPRGRLDPLPPGAREWSGPRMFERHAPPSAREILNGAQLGDRMPGDGHDPALYRNARLFQVEASIRRFEADVLGLNRPPPRARSPQPTEAPVARYCEDGT